MAGSEERSPLTRERSVQVAVALADAGGIEAVSMRKVAAELGVQAMSLYHHVKHKEELLDGMLDVVHSEFKMPRIGGPWRDELHARAQSMRSVYARHPWALGIKARTSPGRETLGHLDAVIGCLRTAGFSMVMTGHAISLPDSYVLGFAQEESSLPLDRDGSIGDVTKDIVSQQADMAEAFPHLSEMAAKLILTPGYAYANEFDFGLELVLDGIESAHKRDGAGRRRKSGRQ